MLFQVYSKVIQLYFSDYFSLLNKILNLVPWAIQWDPTVFLFYIKQCVPVNPMLLIYPPLPSLFGNHDVAFAIDHYLLTPTLSSHFQYLLSDSHSQLSYFTKKTERTRRELPQITSTQLTMPKECVCVHMCVCVLSCFSHIRSFVTLWTVANQAPLSMGFSRREYRSGLPRPSQGIFPTPGWNISYVSCIGRWVLYHQRHLGRLSILQSQLKNCPSPQQ